MFHGPEGARRARIAQGNCARARLPIAPLAVFLASALLATGCAHRPSSTSGSEARARFLVERASAAAGAPVRGVGDVDADVAGKSGSFEARWGSKGDSMVVIGYSGPVRALDASLLDDSVYVAIRPKEFAVTGVLNPTGGFGAEGLGFLLRPWDFSAPWVREALERAAAEPVKDGWRFRGTGKTNAGEVSFTLDITSRGEPRRLEIARADDPRGAAVVRYGALRGFAAGRYPRWVEWSREDARVRLDVREMAPLPDGRLRLLPPASRDWRVVGLDDPDGEAMLGRLLGGREREEDR